MERLETEGYIVLRTAGSHSPCDLIAFYPGQKPIGVQAKGGKRGMSKPEKLRFKDWCEDAGVQPLLVERGMRFDWLREAA
jgi:hypothetical protein